MHIKKAREIALRDLRACYGPLGIRAGLHHFSDYWARDAFFSSLGAISAGDNEIARRTIDAFIKNQGTDGQIPLRIGSSNFFLKFLGIRTDEKAVFGEDKHANNPIDPSLLFIIAAGALNYQKSELKKILGPLELAHNWARRNSGSNVLLVEKEYCGWMDSIKKKGMTFYTNLLYWKATVSISDLCKKAGEKNKAKEYKKLALRIFRNVNNSFWNGEYFSDWIDGEVRDFCPTGEQFLAIYWGFASKKKSEKIMKFVERHQTTLCFPVYPEYPSKYRSFFLKLVGMGDYHSKLRWIWICCLQAIAYNKIGNNKKASQIIESLSELILKYGSVYEVYDSSNKPLKRIFYRSERPFAWSCGFFLLALKKLKLS